MLGFAHITTQWTKKIPPLPPFHALAAAAAAAAAAAKCCCYAGYLLGVDWGMEGGGGRRRDVLPV